MRAITGDGQTIEEQILESSLSRTAGTDLREAREIMRGVHDHISGRLSDITKKLVGLEEEYELEYQRKECQEIEQSLLILKQYTTFNDDGRMTLAVYARSLSKRTEERDAE